MLRLLAALPCLLATCLPASGQAPAPGEVSRVAFGSCARADRPQPWWDPLLRYDPQVWIWAGDTIYADSPRPAGDTPEAQARVVLDRMPVLYEAQKQILGYQLLRQRTFVTGTWDDHDYGANDAGVEFPGRVEARRHFWDFYDEPADSPLRQRDGVYQSHLFGPPGRRVQVILLDTRSHRSPLREIPRAHNDRRDWVEGRPGFYAPETDPAATLLGEAQWAWLEGRLREPAEVRLIVSSLQVVADDHRFEKWGNLPHERARLLGLIRDTGARGVVLLSGDRHLAELSRLSPARAERENLPHPGYPIYDLTSSALTQSRATVFADQLDNWSEPRAMEHRNELNRYRLGALMRYNNYGTVAINWDHDESPEITLALWTDRGTEVLRHRFLLSSLQ
jgi:alkaline phosphatase D